MHPAALSPDDARHQRLSGVALNVHQAGRLALFEHLECRCVPGIALEHGHPRAHLKLFPERTNALKVLRIFNNCATKHEDLGSPGPSTITRLEAVPKSGVRP